eukprot:TRINITY_DN3151_c0_g2_i1.p1 TRINITY_DN3151_c0_g2~~TRINITY_DN3151_c0_g2_i1.p1  ORF type:complete len:269 (-),score=52.16 TRINITY_DN3151_c0_g2_i1:3-809(-)
MNDSEERSMLENAKMNKLTLHFTDPELERAFCAHHTEISIHQVRVASIVALVVVILFFLSNLIEDETNFETIVMVIMLNSLVVLALGVFILFTYTDMFADNMQRYLLGIFIFSGVVFSLISFFKQSAGIIFIVLFIVFCFLVPRLLFLYSSTLALVAIGVFEVVYYQIEIDSMVVPIELFIEYNLFIIVAVAMNMLAGYLMELYIRQDYVTQRRLALEHNKSEKLLYAMLPHTVVEKMKSGVEQTAEEATDVSPPPFFSAFFFHQNGK